MQFIDNIKYKVMNSLLYFAIKGYKQPYKLIFGTPQFPFWFCIQCIYSCYIVTRSTIKSKLTFSKILKTLICTALMVFAPRELFAYVSNKKSPIQNNQQIVIYYAVIYFLMILPAPFNIFYKLVHYLGYFLAIVEGANQARFLTLILRVVKNNSYSLLYANAFAFMDLAIEMIMRPLSNGENIGLSSIGIIFKGLLFSTFYELTTNRNKYTIYIGLYKHYIPALLLTACYAIINSTAYIRQVLAKKHNKNNNVSQNKEEQKQMNDKKNE